jgi:hypothetical protein
VQFPSPSCHFFPPGLKYPAQWLALKHISSSESGTKIHTRYKTITNTYFCFVATAPQWARASSFTRYLDHTRPHSIVGRTPLDEWSSCLRDLYLTTHKTHNRQTSMPPVGFEPKISAGERPQGHWDRHT